jgi:hypothetical protein
LTVLALACLLVTGCASSTGRSGTPASKSLTQTIYSDDGVSELLVPDTWTVRPDFGPDAAIRVAEGNGKAFLLVNSYLPSEMTATAIAEFSRSYAMGLTESLPNSTASRGQLLEINSAPAHRYVVTGDVGDVRLTYVSTVVRGVTALHHLIGWVAASDYSGDSDVLNRVIASFRESPDPRAPKQRVALSFAWPETLQSAVNFRQNSVTHGKATELKAIYLTTVRPGNDDELVVSTRVMSQHAAPDETAESDYTSTLLRQLTAEIPDYVVSRAGEFIRVDNLHAYQQRVENAVVSKLPPDVIKQKDKILALVRPGLSEQFLSAAVTNEWNKVVGGWAGSSYVPGQTYLFNEAYYSPMLGDAPFVMTVARRVSGFAPCSSSQPDCVRLVQTATVAGDDFRSAMKRFLEKAVGRPVTIRQISVVKNTEVIAEPDTLIPHRSRSTEETTVIIEDADGKTHTSSDTEDTRVTYSYESYSAAR